MSELEPNSELLPNAKKPWFKRKRLIIPIALVVIGAVSGEVSAFGINSEFKNFEKSIQQNIQNDDFNLAKVDIMRFKSQYGTCVAILFCNYVDNFNQIEIQVETLAASRSRFEQAETHLANKDYTLAIDAYEKVSNLDQIRFSRASEQIRYAQSLLEKQNDSLVADAINSARNLSARGNHIGALAELDKVRNLANQSNDFIELNAVTLLKAEEQKRKIEVAQNAQYVNALRSMRKTTDKFDDHTFYQDASTPRYANYSTFHLYIGKSKNSNPYLRFKVRYSDDTWLFVDSASINIDGEIYELDIASSEWETDNDSRIWEWADVEPTNYQLSLIDKVIKSRSATVRFFGSQYRDDRTLTSTQKRALSNVLNAYQALKKGLN